MATERDKEIVKLKRKLNKALDVLDQTDRALKKIRYEIEWGNVSMERGTPIYDRAENINYKAKKNVRDILAQMQLRSYMVRKSD